MEEEVAKARVQVQKASMVPQTAEPLGPLVVPQSPEALGPRVENVSMCLVLQKPPDHAPRTD